MYDLKKRAMKNCTNITYEHDNIRHNGQTFDYNVRTSRLDDRVILFLHEKASFRTRRKNFSYSVLFSNFYCERPRPNVPLIDAPVIKVPLYLLIYFLPQAINARNHLNLFTDTNTYRTDASAMHRKNRIWRFKKRQQTEAKPRRNSRSGERSTSIQMAETNKSKRENKRNAVTSGHCLDLVLCPLRSTESDRKGETEKRWACNAVDTDSRSVRPTMSH